MDTFRDLVDSRLSQIEGKANLCEDIINSENEYRKLSKRHGFAKVAAVAACAVMCAGGVAGASFVLRPELAGEMAPDSESRRIIEESGRVHNVAHAGDAENDTMVTGATDNGITISLLQYVGGPNRLKCVFEVKGDAIRDIPMDTDEICAIAGGGISKVNDERFAIGNDAMTEFANSSATCLQDFGMRTSEDSFTFITENYCDMPVFENGNVITFAFEGIMEYMTAGEENAEQSDKKMVAEGNWELSVPLEYEYDAIHYDINKTVDLFGKEVKVMSVDLDEMGYRIHFDPDSVDSSRLRDGSISVVYDYQGNDTNLEKEDDREAVTDARKNGWLSQNFGDYTIYYGGPSDENAIRQVTGAQREPLETVLLLDRNGYMVGGLGQGGGDETDGYVREGVWYYYGNPDESGDAKITEVLDPAEVTTLKFMNGYEIKLK